MDLTDLINKGVRDVAWDNPLLWQGTQSAAAVGSVTVQAAQATKKNVTPSEAYSFNIAVNAAVGAIMHQFGQAQGRLFNRGGEEINGGELYEVLKMPAPGMSYCRWIEDVAAWYNITGEFAIRVGELEGNFPRTLTPLCPAMLEPEKPVSPRSPGQVVQWRYVWADGATEYIRGDYLAFDRMFNPNPYSIRGLSPLVVGAVQISGQIAAEAYNKSFFDNGGIPSHLVVLPDGVPKQHREDFEKRYLSEYGRWNSNAHKVMVVAGKDVDVKSLEEPFQDGAFMEMMKRGDLKVGQLYRVPAINMGIYDKTRFDTANEERKLFLEETLKPQAAVLSAAIQQQIIDRHYRFSSVTVRRPRKGERTMGKAMDRMFEKARSERPDSPIIFCIDPDTLPVANDVALAKMEHVQKLRDATMISPADATEYVGLDIEDDRPERREIWAENKFVCITDPDINAKLVPGVAGEKPGDKKPGGVGDDKKPEAKPKPKKELTAEDRQRRTNLKTLVHKLRTLTLESMADVDARLWSLDEADGLNKAGDMILADEIRKIRFALRQIVKQHSDKAKRVIAVREYLDSLDGQYIKGVLGLD